MKTLIASPFEDDAFLTFYDFLARDLRVGQAFMNVLSLYDGESYERLSGSLVDPFYRDERIPAALDKMTSK